MRTKNSIVVSLLMVAIGVTAIFAFAVETWKPTSMTNPPAGRQNHTAVWTGSKMIVWGGVANNSQKSGATYDPATDTWLAIPDAPIPGRLYHTAVWTGSKMIVWGGLASGGFTNTGAIYDPVTSTWVVMPVNGAPSPRMWHTAVWTGTKMIVWGGYTGSPGGVGTNTGGEYDPVSNTWAETTTLSPLAPVEPRYWHTAVWTGTKMIVWGGQVGPHYTNTGMAYDPLTKTWSMIRTPTNVPGRYLASAVWTGSKMVIWGGVVTDVNVEHMLNGFYPLDGQNFQRLTNTGGVYDPLTDTWSATSTLAAPSARWGNSTVWSGTEMIIWGGVTESEIPEVNNGGRYNPISNTWLPISASTGSPIPRSSHSAVWTGTQMIIWGGHSAETRTNTGGILTL